MVSYKKTWALKSGDGLKMSPTTVSMTQGVRPGLNQISGAYIH